MQSRIAGPPTAIPITGSMPRMNTNIAPTITAKLAATIRKDRRNVRRPPEKYIRIGAPRIVGTATSKATPQKRPTGSGSMRPPEEVARIEFRSVNLGTSWLTHRKRRQRAGRRARRAADCQPIGAAALDFGTTALNSQPDPVSLPLETYFAQSSRPICRTSSCRSLRRLWRGHRATIHLPVCQDMAQTVVRRTVPDFLSQTSDSAGTGFLIIWFARLLPRCFPRLFTGKQRGAICTQVTENTCGLD